PQPMRQWSGHDGEAGSTKYDVGKERWSQLSCNPVQVRKPATYLIFYVRRSTLIAVLGSKVPSLKEAPNSYQRSY
ncbi:MAG: hypothetical protein KAX80_09200, partial [Planctomycetes bacterium]|nr:hypothetical protein [Planctomycetota bacterium]